MKKLVYPQSIIRIFSISVFFFLVHKAVRYPIENGDGQEIGLIKLIFTHKEFPSFATGVLVMAIYISIAAVVFFQVRKALLANRHPILTHLFFLFWAIWGLIETHHFWKPILFGKIVTFFFVILASIVLPALLLLHAFGSPIFAKEESPPKQPTKE